MRGKKKISYENLLHTALSKPAFLRMIREFDIDINNVNYLLYEKLKCAVKVKLETIVYKLDILLKFLSYKTSVELISYLASILINVSL